MKTIKIEIPENTQFEKAEVIGGMLVTSFKEVDKEPIDGDILALSTSSRCVFAFKSGHYKTSFHVGVTSCGELHYGSGRDAMGGNSTPCDASDEQKQLLFNALAKEGKYWDAEALEVKEYLKVPESIGIYKDNSIFSERYGDGLSISFNEGKQLLRVDAKEGIYIVDFLLRLRGNAKTNCYLQPTTYEDLKVGDTFFCSLKPDYENLNKYYKKLANTQCRVGNNKYDVILTDFDFYRPIKFYKLILIQ